MNLFELPGEFAVCKLTTIPSPPSDSRSIWSLSVTRNEISLVCPLADAPEGATVEGDWGCFVLAGPMPFTLTGIVAGVTAPLAAAKIPIFVMSTFDTDYLLVKQSTMPAAIRAWTDAGYMIHRTSP